MNELHRSALRAAIGHWHWLGIFALGAGIASWMYGSGNHKSAAADVAKTAAGAERGLPDAGGAAAQVRVETVHPRAGGLERTTVQPGSVYAFQGASLFAKVSGFLKSQSVDIGDRVRQGQVLAEIYAPELDLEVSQAAAALAQANAEVAQMKARVITAEAKQQAAQASVVQTEADVQRVAAEREYREKQYRRLKSLFELNSSIDARLVDEKQNEWQAAQAAERVAQAAIVSAKADLAAAAAKIEEAKSDVANSLAKVQVAQAALDKAKVMADYKKIVSPYDGVVIRRTFNPGDFIRTAERSGEMPLLVVDRTDLMRVVVEIPDMDVPLIQPGDKATIEVDALTGEIFTGTVARIAHAEESRSRTMRAEIDLPNPDGRLKQGMYGRATIELRTAGHGLTIPTSCLAGPLKDGKGSVYVVRAGKACLVPVQVASDDGSRVEIRSGVTPEDEIVSEHSGAIAEGIPVAIGRTDF